MRTPSWILRSLLAAATCSLAACGAPAGSAPEAAEATGQATLAITTVPAGAQCIQITVAGSSTVSRQLPVTAGASTVGLALGALPLGSDTITGQAFNVACTSLAGASPSYVADTQTATIQPGVVTNLTMTFRPNNAVSAVATFVGNVVGVTVSETATLFVLSDGTVRASGLTYYLTSSQIPVPVPGLSNVTQIAGGDGFWCAVLTGGSVQCWGFNNAGDLGIGGTTATNALSGAVTVPGVSNAVQIVAGFHFACALESTGAVQCWGDNTSGALGNGTTTTSFSPVTVINAPAFAQLAASAYSVCGITTAGAVDCWGSNSNGQLGNGTTTNATVPTQVSGLHATVGLAAGGAHVCAQRADGTVRCWGGNGSGQLGIGTTNQSLTPVQIPLTGVAQIAASATSTCARNANGLYCWGDNSVGAVGDGTGTTARRPSSSRRLRRRP